MRITEGSIRTSLSRSTVAHMSRTFRPVRTDGRYVAVHLTDAALGKVAVAVGVSGIKTAKTLSRESRCVP